MPPLTDSPTESKDSTELRLQVEAANRDLAAKKATLKRLYDAAKSENGQWVMDPEAAEQIRTLETTCLTLTDKLNSLTLDFQAVRNAEDLDRLGATKMGPALWPGQGGNGKEEAEGAAQGIVPLPSSLGTAFVAGKSYGAWTHGGQGQHASVEVPAVGMRGYALKATLATSTGPFTSIDKFPAVVQLGQQELTVADLMSQAQTASPTIRYIQEDSFTNAADMVAEEGAKPEATWDLSEVDAVVRKIAVVTKVTDELFQDQPAIRDYIDQRLPFMVRQREELQLINGTGVGQQVLGILNVTGILTPSIGGDNNIDYIYKAITAVRTQGFFEPDAIVLNPTNWTPIRLAKTTTGEYVYGDPYVAGPETIFGKRVVLTVNMPAGSGVVGAWRIGSTLFMRQGIRIEATNSDQDDFIKNRVTLRGEERIAPVWWRPKAFAKLASLAS